MNAVLLPLPAGEGGGEGQPRVEEPRARYLVELQPLLVRSFDLLATAPQGVAKLRELILSLAVKGKLSTQRASDEPADQLMDRIRWERNRLVESKALRASKPLPTVEEDERPFSLPHGWGWARLGDIGDWGAGATPSRTHPSYYGGGIPWFKSGELSADLISRSEETITPLALEKCSLRLNSVGDVLIAMYGATIGKTAILAAPATTNQAVCACTPFTGFQNRYLLLLLKALRPYFIGIGAGGAQPNISREKIVGTVIGVPPTAEQARIVARVEELMTLCDALEQRGRLEAEQHARLLSTLFDALAASENAQTLAENWQRIAQHFDLLLDRPEAIDALEQTIVQLAVRGLLVPQNVDEGSGDDLLQRHISATGSVRTRSVKALEPMAANDAPFSVPANWAWARFGEIVDVSGGVTLGRKGALAKPVTLPYLRVANVQRGHLNLVEDLKTVTIAASELPRFALQTGDLLITEGGDWDKVGRTCIWRNEVENCLHQNHVFKVRGRSPDWLPEWGELYLNSQDARAYFAASAKQTTNLASINMTELRHCAFPLPPLAEQHRIVARVNELRALCAQLRERLQQARHKQTLLANALVASTAN